MTCMLSCPLAYKIISSINSLPTCVFTLAHRAVCWWWLVASFIMREGGAGIHYILLPGAECWLHSGVFLRIFHHQLHTAILHLNQPTKDRISCSKQYFLSSEPSSLALRLYLLWELSWQCPGASEYLLVESTDLSVTMFVVWPLHCGYLIL